jgi:Family of unknown function (DUF6152)
LPLFFAVGGLPTFNFLLGVIMLRKLCSVLLALAVGVAFAHHGWSSFDETKPIYLEGTVKSVKWQNPHAEVMLEINRIEPPAALTRFAIPKQSAPVDAVTVLGTAKAPTRKDALWEVEFAPITRMDAWKVAPIKVGEKLRWLATRSKTKKARRRCGLSS